MRRPALRALFPLLAAVSGSACRVHSDGRPELPSSGGSLPPCAACLSEGAGRRCPAARGRGSDCPDCFDELGLIQVSLGVEPAPVISASAARFRRWASIGDYDDPLLHTPLQKRKDEGPESAVATVKAERHLGAMIGCIIGYVAFTLIITRLYWQQGFKVIFYVASYITSLAMILLSIKHIYKEYNFAFPMVITAVHLLFSTLAGFTVLLSRAWLTGKPLFIPTGWEYLSRIVPISVCFGGAIGLSNLGLLYVSPVLAEIVGSLSPLISVPLTMMMGLPFRLLLSVPIAIVVVGAITAVQPWDVTASVWGILWFLIATLLRSVKSVLQQEVMTGVLRERFDEYSLLAWSCLTSCVMMFVWSFASEQGEPWVHFARSTRKFALAANLAASVVIAILVNLSHLWVTKELGAVSSQLLAQTKAVLILLGSMAFLGESNSTQELIGFGLVLFGTFLYGVIQQNLLFAEKK